MVQYDVSEVGSLPSPVRRCTSIASKVWSSLLSLGVLGEGEYPSGCSREETGGSSTIDNPTKTTAVEKGRNNLRPHPQMTMTTDLQVFKAF